MSPPIDYADLEAARGVNYWTLDRTLQREVARTYPADALEWATPRLEAFGGTVGTAIADNADVVDRNGPTLSTYDREGDLANRVAYHPAHRENERLVYGAGIVADCFHAPPGRDAPLPLVHNLAMQYLLSYADPGLDCPVAMTTGVALVLERFDDGDLERYLRGLTSRDPDELIEGAMFLTERQGGSDVGAIETVATPAPSGDAWRLEGEKWFCSNIDAQGTLTLARTPDAPSGTAGLSMFLVPHRRPDGTLNDQRYRRLKDKLGTISVPTGEVEFDGATGYLVGERERGFAQMAEMMNLERLSNAAASCGIIGRALLESKVHAADREAFGRRLDRHPLMRVDLVDMAVDHEAATTFTFEAARVFARRERARRDGDDDRTAYRLMRVLVPVAKARTARMAVETASYAMEVQGGNGYVREFVTHRLLRDAQVLPIWEGTENILSLDVLRAFEREDAHAALLERVEALLRGVDDDRLAGDVARVREASDGVASTVAGITDDPAAAQRVSKRLLHRIFDVVTASLLLAGGQAAIERDDDARLAVVARRFVDRHLDGGGRVPADDPLVDAHFDAVVRYGRVDPGDLGARA